MASSGETSHQGGSRSGSGRSVPGTEAGVERGPHLAEAAVASIVSIAAEAVRDEIATIERVAAQVAGRLHGGGRLFGYGAGHAYAFAMELCSRAGGLPRVVAMNLDDLRQTPRKAKWQLMDSEPERVPANGPALLGLHGVGARDAVVIASQSGRNGAAVEMALSARARGAYVAAVTSLQHSRSVPSRHPSGKRLYEVCEDVVDNHCPPGDAVLEVAGGRRISSASTVSFALIAQALNAALVEGLEALGAEVDVLLSANVDRPAGPSGASLPDSGRPSGRPLEPPSEPPAGPPGWLTP